MCWLACGLSLKSRKVKIMVMTRDEFEAYQYNKATKVPLREYTGDMIYCDEEYIHTGDLEEYIDEVFTWVDETPPKYVWACKQKPLVMDVLCVIENAIENQEHHEDALNELDIESLQAAMDAWCEVQQLKSWVVDYSTAVMIDGLFD